MENFLYSLHGKYKCIDNVISNLKSNVKRTKNTAVGFLPIFMLVYLLLKGYDTKTSWNAVSATIPDKPQIKDVSSELTSTDLGGCYFCFGNKYQNSHIGCYTIYHLGLNQLKQQKFLAHLSFYRKQRHL